MRGSVFRIALATALGIATAYAQTESNIPRPLPPPNLPAVKPIEPADSSVPKKLDTFSDKVTRCLHYGGGKGVPPNELGQFTSRCVHAQ